MYLHSVKPKRIYRKVQSSAILMKLCIINYHGRASGTDTSAFNNNFNKEDKMKRRISGVS